LEDVVKIGLLKIGFENINLRMLTGSRSYPVVGFGVSNVQPSDAITGQNYLSTSATVFLSSCMK
jgi:hypothetical protein